MEPITVGKLGLEQYGAQVFTTTIRNTTVQQVREVSLAYMMGRDFAIDRVEEYTITFTKGFGDGVWTEYRNMIVKFNVLQKDDDVKLMVTQFEDSPPSHASIVVYSPNLIVVPYYTQRRGQRAIGHLIPLIKDIRHSIDGTPLDRIVNEAADQQPEIEPIKTSGLSFDGFIIKAIEPGSLAEKAGLQPGDTIVEINGKSADENALKNIDVRLAAGRYVMITYERNGNKDLVTLK